MTRTAWFFTLSAIWFAPLVSRFTSYLLGVGYAVYACYSWYRESKHKDVSHV